MFTKYCENYDATCQNHGFVYLCGSFVHPMIFCECKEQLSFALSPPRHSPSLLPPVPHKSCLWRSFLSFYWADLICQVFRISTLGFGVLIFCQFHETKNSWWRPLGIRSGTSKPATAVRIRMVHSLPWGENALSQLYHWNVPLFYFKLINHWCVTYAHWEDCDNQTCQFIKDNYSFSYSEFDENCQYFGGVLPFFSSQIIKFGKLKSGKRKSILKVLEGFLSVLLFPGKDKLHNLGFSQICTVKLNAK